MGSGRKSNGKRPVNKTDGRKKKAKKQMTKSRRADAKKEVQTVKPAFFNSDFYDDVFDDDELFLDDTLSYDDDDGF